MIYQSSRLLEILYYGLMGCVKKMRKADGQEGQEWINENPQTIFFNIQNYNSLKSGVERQTSADKLS